MQKLVAVPGVAVAVCAQAKLSALRMKYWINRPQNLLAEIILTHLSIEKSLFFNILLIVPRAQELELEDHQSRLEQKLREKMAVDGK